LQIIDDRGGFGYTLGVIEKNAKEKPKLNHRITKLLVAWILLVGMVGSVGTFMPGSVSAQTINPAEAPLNLIILPNKREYQGMPGGSIRGTVRVRNNGLAPVENMVPVVVDFGPSGNETGDPRVIEREDDPYGYRLSPWIRYEQEPVTIEAENSVEIEYLIEIPEDAIPGGRYGMLYLEQVTPGEGQSAVGVRTRLGSLILVTVLGPMNIDADIVEFYTGKNLYEYLPVDFHVRVENRGNIHIAPVGSIFIHDWQDRWVGTVHVNSNAGNVLPESIRRFSGFWSEAFLVNEFVRDIDGNLVLDASGDEQRELTINWNDWNLFRFGRYEARALIVFDDPSGRNEHQMVATTTFWVIPWKLILIILGSIFLLTVVARYTIRRYNDRLIREYEKGKGLDYKEVSAERKKRQEKRVRREERRQRIKYQLGQWRDKALAGLGIRSSSDSAEERSEAPEPEARPEKEDKKATRSKNNESSSPKSKKKEDKHSVFRDPDRLDWE